MTPPWCSEYDCSDLLCVRTRVRVLVLARMRERVLARVLARVCVCGRARVRASAAGGRMWGRMIARAHVGVRGCAGQAPGKRAGCGAWGPRDTGRRA